MIKYFVIRNFRGTCSSVKMLKGYMVRERLGTPAVKYIIKRCNMACAILPWTGRLWTASRQRELYVSAKSSMINIWVGEEFILSLVVCFACD